MDKWTYKKIGYQIKAFAIIGKTLVTQLKTGRGEKKNNDTIFQEYDFMRKVISYILLIFLLTACDRYKGEIIVNSESSTIIQSEVSFCRDTLLINHLQFIQTMNEDTTRFCCLTALNGDTIIPFADYYHRMELLDINEDGTTDIRVFIFSNTPNQCDNYLFDQQDDTYRFIKSCDLDIKKITGTDLYYSYNAVGCADMNWESYLGKIENYRLVTFGRIYGNGCDDDIKNKRTITIYKVSGENDVLIKTMPYTKNIPNFSDKWEFIEQYWSQNYQEFK